MLYVFFALCLSGRILVSAEKCPDFNPAKNLDLAKLAKCSWAMHRSIHPNGNNKSPFCTVMEFEYHKQNGNFHHTVYEKLNKNKAMVVRSAMGPVNPNGRARFTMNTHGGKDSYDLQIRSTDYETFLIMSTCKVVNKNPKVEIHVLTRSYDFDLSVLKKVEFDPKRLDVRDPKKCKSDYNKIGHYPVPSGEDTRQCSILR